MIGSAVWGAVLLLWLPVAVIVLRGSSDDQAEGAVGPLIGVVVGLIIATAAVGFLFGLTTQVRWVWFAAVLGTGAQMTGYVPAMLMVPQPGGAEDIATVTGLIMFSLPTLLAVTALLWVGAGVGLLVRVIRRRARQ